MPQTKVQKRSGASTTPDRNRKISSREVLDFLAGGGEMGERIRAFDWSKTSLGPISNWPQSLKTAVRIMLTSRQPFWLGWGPDLIKLYNDAYKGIVGGKHPLALGQPASVVWREIWPEIGPMLQKAMEGVEGTYVEEQLLIMERNGYPEETYYTFSYSPIPDDSGRVGGIICANTQDTARVIGERQSALLRELASRPADAREVAEACRISGECLGADRRDITFGLIYLADKTTGRLHLMGMSDSSLTGTAIAPLTVELSDTSTWPLREAFENAENLFVSDVPPGAQLPKAWEKPSQKAALIQITAKGEQDQRGLLIAGLNPFRLLDASYREFLQRASSQIGTNIRNASAYEAERKRAEALAELDRAKTAFFSNVSHEFRTPLTLMLGPLEELLRQGNGSLSPASREQLVVTHRNSLRLLKLVNTLLDFSRIEAGRVQATFEPTDLAASTSELCGLFRATIEKSGMRLAVDCPPLGEPVYVDREMWERIVLNLLSNAFKFTHEGEIKVQLRRSAFGVDLRISDSGIGIPADEIPNIFKRFHRVEGARGRSFEGSGIGLALVSELVRLHHGSIAVQSVVGKGSEFTVSIPLGAAHLPPQGISTGAAKTTTTPKADAFIEEALLWLPPGKADSGNRSAPHAAETAYPAPPNGAGGSKARRVLVADDNADMRNYVRRLLSRDYEVMAVHDGEAALSAVHTFEPDLILTDVMMPRLDGVGLLRAVRADTRLRTIPVILLSARAGEESRVEGLASGADDYLVKPFSARELVARVESHLNMAKFRHDSFMRERALREEAETQRKNAQEIVESISDGFISLDREWTFTYVNRAAERILGKSAHELIGKNHWQEFPLGAGTIVEREYRRAAAEQVTVEFENFYEPWHRWFDVKAYPSSQGLAVYFRDITERKEKSRKLEALNRIGSALTSELNLEKLVQAATDAGRDVTGAAFGAFFYNVQDDEGESYTLYTLSGAPREAFSKFPMPRNTAVFGPTFRGEGVVRIADIQKDPRYGKNPPYRGMPEGHLPVRSYLAAPVKSRSGEVLGGLFYGHPEPNIFSEESERVLVAIAAQAGIAIDNANLYRAVQSELAAHKLAEDALRERENQLRAATEALKTSEERFRLASFSDAITLYEQDSDLRYLWLYPLHPEHEHALGKSDPELLQNEHGRELAAWKREVMATGKPQRREARTSLSTGARVYDVFILPKKNAAGEIVGVAGTALDITERKSAEATAKRLAAIVESSDDAIVSKDLDGVIASWNQGAERVFGYSAAEVIGKPITILIPPDRLDEEPRILSQIRSGHRIDHFSTVRRRKDGSLINVSLTVSPVRNDAGQIVGASKVARDITELVRAQEKLEQTVAARTAHLRATIGELERFSYSLSHDMRAPLRAIHSFIQIVLEDAGTRLTDQERDLLQKCVAASNRLDRLIQDVLTYSKFTRELIHLQPIDLAALLRQIIGERPEFHPPVADIVIDCPRPWVMAHEAYLTQIVTNLLGNAVKFVAKGVQPRIHITCEARDRRVRISIADNGIGIPPEAREKIFGMFQRMHTEAEYEGTGIGLTIARKAVERMNGEIGVEAGENGGSRFWIELPAFEGPPPAAQEAVQEAHAL